MVVVFPPRLSSQSPSLVAMEVMYTALNLRAWRAQLKAQAAIIQALPQRIERSVAHVL